MKKKNLKSFFRNRFEWSDFLKISNSFVFLFEIFILNAIFLPLEQNILLAKVFITGLFLMLAVLFATINLSLKSIIITRQLNLSQHVEVKYLNIIHNDVVCSKNMIVFIIFLGTLLLTISSLVNTLIFVYASVFLSLFVIAHSFYIFEKSFSRHYVLLNTKLNLELKKELITPSVKLTEQSWNLHICLSVLIIVVLLFKFA